VCVYVWNAELHLLVLCIECTLSVQQH